MYFQVNLFRNHRILQVPEPRAFKTFAAILIALSPGPPLPHKKMKMIADCFVSEPHSKWKLSQRGGGAPPLRPLPHDDHPITLHLLQILYLCQCSLPQNYDTTIATLFSILRYTCHRYNCLSYPAIIKIYICSNCDFCGLFRVHPMPFEDS